MTAVTQAQDFMVAFRKNNDGLEDRDTSIIYYAKNAPVEIGTLLQYKGNYYIVLNKKLPKTTYTINQPYDRQTVP